MSPTRVAMESFVLKEKSYTKKTVNFNIFLKMNISSRGGETTQWGFLNFYQFFLIFLAKIAKGGGGGKPYKKGALT